jgi:alpha-tubulin suppressor-like RCC1 family protein
MRCLRRTLIAVLTLASLATSFAGYNTSIASASTPMVTQQTSPVVSLPAFSSVAAGDLHTCAVATDKTVMCWGQNDSYQLGTGSTKSLSTPTLVSGLQNVASLALGGQHSCALDASGAVSCWGSNKYGQTGSRGLRDRTPVGTPRTVKLPKPAKALTAGSKHTCALLTTGEVYCWGFNASGQLGTGRTLTAWAPMKTRTMPAASQVSAGSMHTCAVVASSLYCWGQNSDRQIGLSLSATSIPTKVPSLVAVSMVTTGTAHTCVLSGGSVLCSGRENQFQTSTPPVTTPSSTPQKPGASSTTTTTVKPKAGAAQSSWRTVQGLQSPSLVAAHGDTSCALVTAGGVFCWGRNRTGELGRASALLSDGPGSVLGASRAPLTGVSSVVQGAEHVCALKASVVLCWGSGMFGQLGTGIIRRQDLATPLL